MFDELKKYNQNDHFFFKPTDDLRQACNAPTDRSGIYLIYVLKAGKVELVYIGRSGEVKSDGSLFVRKAGIGGFKRPAYKRETIRTTETQFLEDANADRKD